MCRLPPSDPLPRPLSHKGRGEISHQNAGLGGEGYKITKELYDGHWQSVLIRV